MFNNSGWNDYNNMSMICLVEHKGVKSLYTGDCYEQALNRAVKNGFVNTKINLYKIEHHGINDHNSGREVLRLGIPDYAVQLSTLKDSMKNNYSNTK